MSYNKDNYEPAFRSRDDHPKYSRLFIIGGKNTTEEEIENRFSEYGDIEYIDVKKDRDTGAMKGFTYVKYAKTSQAADALEATNGSLLSGDARPIKVVIANNSKTAGMSGPDSDINATRLFVMCPKTRTVEELKETFGEYGEVEHVSLVYDRDTSEPRGLAYINFHKFSAAARAVENCDADYKAKFAEPKAPQRTGGGGSSSGESFSRGGYGGGGARGGDSMGTMMSMMGGGGLNPNGVSSLKVLFDPSVSKDSFWALFNVVPGLLSCDFVEMRRDGMAISAVAYSNPTSAAHAMERLNGFEYPTGCQIQIRFDDGGFGNGWNKPSSVQSHIGAGAALGLPDNIQNLVSTIAKATEVIKTAGYSNVLSNVGYGGQVNTAGAASFGILKKDAQDVCSAKLPPKESTVASNMRCEERLFFVLRDARDCPDPDIITDVFCRFGNLIDAACLRGKKCGYARYASKESAARAIACLDGEDLLCSRFKVEVAEDQSSRGKRPRYDD